MSCILGIDTSSTDLGIGIYRDGFPVASYSRFIGNSHAEHISPLLSTLLSANEIEPRSLHHIVIAQGPGSFTGLRIGIAFVKGLAAGTGGRILPASSLEILAHAAPPGSREVIAAIDARNDDVYTARFSVATEGITRCTDDSMMSREAWYATLTSDSIIVTDTLGYSRSTIFTTLPRGKMVLPVEKHPLQRGLLCAALGAKSIGDSAAWLVPADIKPNYLRRSTPELRLNRKTGT